MNVRTRIRLGVLLWTAFNLPLALADDFQSGDWAWNVDGEAFYAGTTNDAGQLLAQVCTADNGNCAYVVGFDTKCEEGEDYPAMVNTDQGAAAIEFLCGGKAHDGGNLMIAKDFDQMDALLRKSARVGFALPMQGDQFKAIRFSLKGSVSAIDAMRKFAASASDKTPDTRKATNTKDSNVF